MTPVCECGSRMAVWVERLGYGRGVQRCLDPSCPWAGPHDMRRAPAPMAAPDRAFALDSEFEVFDWLPAAPPAARPRRAVPGEMEAWFAANPPRPCACGCGRTVTQTKATFWNRAEKPDGALFAPGHWLRKRRQEQRRRGEVRGPASIDGDAALL